MRVLVTRPEPEAERTAQAVRRLGHDAWIAPVSRIEATGAELPADGVAGVIVSSQNAVRHGVARLAASLRALPVFAVGERTAQAARAAGCGDVRAGPGDAAGLAVQVCGAVRAGGRLLYLAGEPRKPHLEDRLRDLGIEVEVAVVYRAVAARALPGAVCEALSAGTIDAVLHYSREGAARFRALGVAAGLGAAMERPAHLCLSADVAQGLAGMPSLLIANGPNEAALLKLLGDCRSAN